MAKQAKTGRSKAVPSRAPEYDNPTAVTELLASLEHRLKPVIEDVRKTILGADDRITEGVKWNSPSFYCYGWFAAVNAKRAHAVLVVLHHGAKTRPESELSRSIKDPLRLLTWPSPDRAQTSFGSADDFKSKRSEFASLIQQWAAYQERLAQE